MHGEHNSGAAVGHFHRQAAVLHRSKDADPKMVPLPTSTMLTLQAGGDVSSACGEQTEVLVEPPEMDTTKAKTLRAG